MKKTIMWIRSLIFFPCFYIFTFGLAILFSWTLLLPAKCIMFVPIIWSKGNLLLLKWIAGIKVEIKGLENLPKEQGYLVASKHQSAMETVLFHAMVPNAIYVMKKSLLLMPLAGWYFQRTHCIAIDRKKGTSSLRKMLSSAKVSLSQKYNLIVFPEGTRTKPFSTPKYNTGIALLYEQCQVPVVPVALNTGLFWPKNSIKRFPGVATFKFLPPLPTHLNKTEFMSMLEEKIEKETNKMLDKEKSTL